MTTRLMKWGVGLAIALLGGCGGERDALQQQVARLQAELVRVRADSVVLAERLDVMERAQGPRHLTEPAGPSAGGPSAAGDTSDDRPSLEVVRLEPEDEGAPTVLRSGPGGAVVRDSVDRGAAPPPAAKSPASMRRSP